MDLYNKRNTIFLRKIWILIGTFLIILSITYVPWDFSISPEIINSHYKIYQDNLPSEIINYNWSWQIPHGFPIFESKLLITAHINYMIVLRNMILSVCVSLIGYIVTSIVNEYKSSKN